MFTYRRGSRYALPVELEVPTCSKCGALFLDDRLCVIAREALKPTYQREQSEHLSFLVQTIRAKARVSNRELERACGVTPTYLSHVLKGRKDASEILIGLLEGFAICPSEVRRRLERQGAHDTESVKAAIGRTTHWQDVEEQLTVGHWDGVESEAANDAEAA